jgi:hypothetical protein
MDASLKQLLTKNLELHEILDVEIKASGKLHLLDKMLTHIKKNGLKAVVFYQVHFLLLANVNSSMFVMNTSLCAFSIYVHFLFDNGILSCIEI